jgi:hypothetical protein
LEFLPPSARKTIFFFSSANEADEKAIILVNARIIMDDSRFTLQRFGYRYNG